jgi:hypothetical protein
MHDVGLALEQARCENRDLCITNKILVYLLAGCPVVATETQGQVHIREQVPGAVQICDIGDVQSLAEGIQGLSGSPHTLQRAKDRAWTAGEERLNWEKEQKKLIDTISSILR